MKTFKTVANFIIVNSLIFILFVLFFSYYIKNQALYFVLSFVCTFVLSSLFHKISLKKENKIRIKNIDKKQQSVFISQLESLTPSEQNNLIIFALKNQIDKEKNSIVFKKEIYVENFLSQNLTKEKIIASCKKAKKLNKTKVLIFCKTAKNNETIFANSITNFKVEICDGIGLFKLLKNNNYAFEEEIVSNKNIKFTLNKFKEALLRKKNAKTYLGFGFLMLFFSLFTFLKLYYYVFSAIFFSLFMLCIFKKSPQTPQSFIN